MPTPTLTAVMKAQRESSDVHLEIEDGDVWIFPSWPRYALSLTEAEFERLIMTYHALKAGQP